MIYLREMDQTTGLLSADMAPKKGEELKGQYLSGNPYPHIVIDEFMPPAILERCLAEFPSEITADGKEFNRAQESLKYNYSPESLTPPIRVLFYIFNSRPFVRVLENISGIKGLIPDPYFLGGGFHELKTGGYLDIHADFNHHRFMNLERRINVLIYLNKGWQRGFGGPLELWDNEMTQAVQTIDPVFNRCVIFNTTSKSNHGNPVPVNHPDGVSRKSIALYYYTSTWDDTKRAHTTQFHARPESDDKVDWAVKVREFLVDVTPPVISRSLAARKRGRAE